MKRRAFLTGLLGGGAAAASVAIPKPAIASGKREVRLVTTWPRGLAGLGTGAQRIANNITLASEGKLKVKLYAANELVKPFDSFDAVANGDAEMYHGAEYYWTKKSKGFAFFASVPFGMTSSEMYAWIMHMGGQELWDELAAGFNLKSFAAGSTGVQMGGWYNKQINTVKDYQGLKIRMPGLGGEVLKALGAEVKSLPGGAIYNAMKTGKIDATEWIGPWSDSFLNLHKAAKYYYWPGFHEPGTVISLGLNLQFWESLTLDQKSIVRTVCEAENNRMLSEFNAKNGDVLDILVKKHRIRLRTVSNSTLTALGQASGDIVAQIAAEDPFVGRIYNNFIASRHKLLRWNKLSEEAYLVSRRLPFSYGRKVSLNMAQKAPPQINTDVGNIAQTIEKETVITEPAIQQAKKPVTKQTADQIFERMFNPFNE